MLKAYPSTCGAIILGALSASGYDSHSPIEKSPLTLRRHPRLSGIVTAQFVIYLKLFPSDKKSLKGLVRFLASLPLQAPVRSTLKILIDVSRYFLSGSGVFYFGPL